MQITKITVKHFANVYLLVGDRGSVLVDTALPGGEKAILAGCARNKATPDLILVTHGHFDHMGSAAALKRETGAQVAIHSEDSEALRTGISKADHPVGLLARIAPFTMRFIKTDPVEPDTLIRTEMSLKEYGIDGKIVHTPGHTSGSTSVLLDSGEDFVSDLIMGGFFGMICPRRPNLPPFETDRSCLKNSVKYILDQNPAVIYPAHGGPFTPEAVMRWYERL